MRSRGSWVSIGVGTEARAHQAVLDERHRCRAGVAWGRGEGRDVGPLPGFEGMVGQSAPMQALFDRIRRVAPLELAVLILGETGTGKELVAAAVHRLSRRRGGRFEAVNCGALPREPS